MAVIVKLEPWFKSSDPCEMTVAPLRTIGQVSEMLGVAASTLRYYERRGLVVASHRVGGQRRYDTDSIRRLMFVQMMQESGLSLDDIDVILHAHDVDAWKAIAQQRLEDLEEELVRLAHCRELLSAALLCRFDHPLTECWFMNEEIDRRMEEVVA